MSNNRQTFSAPITENRDQFACDEEFKKLSMNEDDDKSIRSLIYITDSEDDSCDSHKIDSAGTDSGTFLSTKEKLKQLEQENKLLAKKIMEMNPKRKISDHGLPKIASSAAVNRKKAQWDIDRTNQILYKKIQSAKASGLSFRKGAALGRETKLSM